MGIVLWLTCAAAVFLAARYVPSARPAAWAGELSAALVSALAFGALATALDFGGWNEPDWRAALFVLFGSSAITGCIRLLRMNGGRESGVGGRSKAAAVVSPAPTPDPRLTTPEQRT
ncbi:MAG TPA: hypothetical protein VLC46_12050 [Thermoanaerobaculia bacterium]|nr:hypothetical protein [Thermoanaerobaculia bacterium]